MLNVLRNKEGFVVSYIEWNRVNEYGQIVKDGLWIHIRHVWIHEDYRKKKAMNKLIYLLDNELSSYGADLVYWFREKYNKRQTDNLDRHRLAKMGVKNDGYI